MCDPLHDAQFAAAQQTEQRGDWKRATDEYGWILAHDPNYAHRGEMARAFARYGDELRARGLLSQAVGYYRQAVDLDPAGPEAGRAGARVALCDGVQALALGHADPGLFRRALSLDPALHEAGQGLARAEAVRARRRWLQAAGSLVLLLAIGIGLWALWRKGAGARSAA